MAGTARKRDAYHHGDLASALVEAAVEMIGESGLSGLSLREVARRAGVSHGAPAHHFGDKAGLLTAVATEGLERFRAAMAEGRDDAGPDPVTRFAATGRAYVRFAVEQRAYFDAIFRNPDLRRDDPAFQAAQQRGFEVLQQAVRESQAAGYADGIDPTSLVLLSWSKAHGLATLWVDQIIGDPSDGDAFERSLDQVFQAD